MTAFDPMTLPLSGNRLIEASAGTGKTYAITSLVLRLLLGRDCTPLPIDKILVLTFTTAATDELKERIAARIHAAHQAFETGSEDDFLRQLIAGSPDPDRDRKLLTAASHLMDEASIFTIHGFCARVLSEQSFESGALFDQQLDAEHDQLLMSAAEDCFRRDILQAESNRRRIALATWPDPAALAKALKPFLFRGALRLDPPWQDTGEELEALADKVTRAKTGWIAGNLSRLIGDAGLHKGRKPVLRLAEMTHFCTATQPDLESELWQVYSKEGLESARTAKSRMPEHEVLDLIDEIAGSQGLLTAARTSLWHEMIERVSERLQQHKEATFKLTYDDLLTDLRQAVLNPGSSMKETIARRWPVAMIDEFQDTDAIQNDIFGTVYQSEPDLTLLMIGDPKQAIYNFRGADIYTYINARQHAASKHSLSTNRRSSPSLIRATNHLFDRRGIFDKADLIPYVAVDHPLEHEDMTMLEGGTELTPYQVFHAGPDDEFGNVSSLRETLFGYAAEETVRLLTESAAGHITLNGDPLHAGHIAFLVRSSTDAKVAQNALAARGIQSVYLTLESVFLQETAGDLKLILEAVMEPANEHAVRAALATRLMLATAEEINNLNDDVRLQQQLLDEFQHYHDTWLEHDVAPMLNSLIDRRRLAEKWLRQPGGERTLTNLRHLMELLQEQSSRASGMHWLIKWFIQEQQKAESLASEERQLRLESDENLVKIVTMHAAKGLEYDIVMIPIPAFTPHRETGPILYHAETADGYATVLDLEGRAHSRAMSDEEKLSEDMRLLYVALTRARYRCYLGLPKSRDLSGSAFGKLLSLGNLDAEMRPAELLELPAELFEVVSAEDPECSTYRQPLDTDRLVEPPTAPVIREDWRIHSYTSVANRISRGESLARPGYADDDIKPQQNEPLRVEPMDRFCFPRGSRAGIVLHKLMEDLDFTDNSGHADLCERTTGRLTLEGSWSAVLGEWLKDILDTRMTGAGTSLSGIERKDRLDEMEFHLPLSTDEGLMEFLRSYGYLGAAQQGISLRLHGMMTGLIDLVFRHGGRYYLADYKSNYLGRDAGAYDQAALETAMVHHQYDLQYLIYTAAITRLLQNRLPDFDYDRDFGGVFYLFLRGMSGADDSGVYFTKPSRAVIEGMIERLDQ